MIYILIIFVVAAGLILYACCLSPVAEKIGAALFPEEFEYDIRRYEAKKRLEEERKSSL